MPNSNNPLPVGDDLYIECELGLDEEIIDYIQETHTLQVRVGGEPFYLWTRQDQGSIVSKSITSWETTGTQYSAYIWQPSDGAANHPNARSQQDKFKVFNDSTPMTRVYDKDSIAYDTEYALVIDVGDDESDAKSVLIWFNEDFTPGNVSYIYHNLCSCVDTSTGYPNRECPLCKGTSYPAAFVQYTTTATKYSSVNTVIIRVPMVAETFTPEQVGRVKRRPISHWMEAAPYVNNFDVIMGTTGRNSGVLFEVVGKRDSRWRGILMHQEFDTIRIEESDIRYSLAPVSVSAVTSDNVTITSGTEIY